MTDATLSSASESRALPDFPHGPIRPFEAWRAFWDLVADRDNTVHVFRFFMAVNGKTAGTSFRRFLKSDFGRKMLADPHYIDRILLDRKTLEAAGPGTVAASYLHYLDSENLHPLGVHQAAKDAAPELWARMERDYPEYAVMRRTTAILHDLYHVLTGYGRDPLGEAVLLEFSGAQSGNRGARLLGRAAGLRIRSEIRSWPVGRMMDNAVRMAREATDLALVDPADYLHLPLDEARAMLNIVPDPVYRKIRAEWTGPEPVSGKAA
ncbi:Coq4 family protein [Marinicauda algicola]|nr:Coq4 family protein [Marinicauda algicola]